MLSYLLRDLLSYLVLLTQVILLVSAVYQLAVSVFGLAPYVNGDSRGALKYFPHFLVLVAAHNEETVVGDIVDNLMSLAYPKDRYDVVVIADNCDDGTAAVSRGHGAVVWERSTQDAKGKGHALRWALHQQADLSRYDGVCVFDADNLVDGNFLEVMGRHLLGGENVIQAYLDSKNPWDSVVSYSYAGAYWYMNRFWQWARSRLGLSGALGGTGFCLSARLLERVPWAAGSLTEDLEFTSRLIEEGERVCWTATTRVYDEKPIRFSQTVPQRTRWLRGHWSTAFSYTKRLLVSMLHQPNTNVLRKWIVIDHLLYLWQPLLILITGINFALTGAEVVVGNGWFYPWLAEVLPTGLWAVLIAIGVFAPLVAYTYEDVDWRAWTYYPAFIVFNLTWIWISAVGLFTHNHHEWIHTVHSRSLQRSELDGFHGKQAVGE